MKIQQRGFREGGFNRIELVAVLAVLTLLATIVWPALAAPRPRSLLSECANNLRQTGQGLLTWAASHNEQFPWVVPWGTEGGAKDAGLSSSWVSFLVASNELGTPLSLVCPADPARTQSRSFSIGAALGAANVSYFVGLHGSLDRPQAWLAGDNNLGGVGGQTCGVAQVTNISFALTNGTVWLPSVHLNAGNLLLTDGSVSQVSNRNLTNFIARAQAQDWENAIHLLMP